MTDRIHSITLVLEENMRDDDAESLIEACRHFRGVIAANGNVADPSDFMAEQRVRIDLERKLFDVVRKQS
jgi:hypothetical protein